jgi:hypothetical protein
MAADNKAELHSGHYQNQAYPLVYSTHDLPADSRHRIVAHKSALHRNTLRGVIHRAQRSLRTESRQCGVACYVNNMKG